MRVLLLLLVLLTTTYTTNALMTPPPFGIGAMLFKPAGTTTRPSEGDSNTLLQAADFFTDAFWAAKIKGGGSQELQPSQRKSLLNSQIMEFRRRYGTKYGGAPKTAELIVATNVRNELMGCCGIELDRIPANHLEGPTLQKAAPLMSNVAVGKKFRRRGVAEDLVLKAEQMARKEWGFTEMFLYVEERNRPAIKLYSKMGYRKLWQDESATTLVPLPNGGLQQAPTTLVCMKKRLDKGGVWGRLFPF